MTPYENDCAVLAHAECMRGIEQHGRFVDLHHALGVIFEEFEEAQKESREVDFNFTAVKGGVFFDRDAEHNVKVLTSLKKAALRAMVEYMQVAAMAEKAIMCIQDMEVQNDAL